MPEIRPDDQLVTQITFIATDPERQAEVLALMHGRAQFMAKQPGFVSISLHRSVDGRRVVNYVQWRSREQLREAHDSPEFRKAWSQFDDLTAAIDPHLFEVVEVLEAA